MVDKRELKQSSLVLAGGLFGLAVAGIVLFLLAGRVGRLEQRIEQAELRGDQLHAERAAVNERAADYADLAEEAKNQAFEAQQLLGEALGQRTRAEWERELARELAERAERDSARAEAEAARVQAGLDNLRAARRRELDRMRDALAAIVETERTPLGMVMRLGEAALRFEFDSPQSRDEDRELLSRIAGVLLTSHGFRLYVDGHTDDQGPAIYNKDLSQRRAAAVRDYLVEAGIPKEVIEARGLGESSPRSQEATQEARGANRRVEIGLVDAIIEYEGDVEP
ncbi:MAG: OmpA family protein [Acidobacteria bacterium]|nr:OmpA family protein [Acidobacteriota bacterium]MDA1233940.1 OmpA family protein [Acidobacteriota bacterium]